MHPAERVILWSAVVILFILYLWPGQSGYVGRKITLMEMREFDKVPGDLQKVYQDNAIRFADALGDVVNKSWNEVSADNKKKVIAKYTDNVTKVIATMQAAKTANGNDMANAFLAPPMDINKNNPQPNPPTTYAPGTQNETSTTSHYMPPPSMFFPMTSGFSLDESLKSVKSTIDSVPKTSGYSAY